MGRRTMTLPGLVIDTAAGTPVYRQIAEGIQTAQRDGRLTAGQQLPPTRDLAKQLRAQPLLLLLGPLKRLDGTESFDYVGIAF